VSLVARYLEANGIPTVVVGCARDIVEHCGVPRFLFSDFPVGNPCGRPFDVAMQHVILGMALELLESARQPRTTVQTPFVWDRDHSWKQRYLSNPADAEPLPRAAGSGVH
jgi:D-proline reductase (dithiol) PrdB